MIITSIGFRIVTYEESYIVINTVCGQLGETLDAIQSAQQTVQLSHTC